MYKVVIIDDEEMIVKGLIKTINWQNYNCEVVGNACDGLLGSELIHKVNPDIVITDISMPGVNGLQMLTALRSEFPDLQVTVLSGYNDFNYAKEAMRLGVRRYLLKPSKMGELTEAIEAMVESLDKAHTATHLPSLQNSEEHDEQSEMLSKETGCFIVRNAIEYMQANYAEKLTLVQVAEHVYVSQWHLSKLMHKHANKNFYDILNEIRINKAKELLKNPQLKINEIGFMVGYADCAHFSKIFKKETGMSANTYRKEL